MVNTSFFDVSTAFTLRRLGISVAIVADDATAAWVQFRCTGYFDISPGAAGDNWVVYSCPALAPSHCGYAQFETRDSKGELTSYRFDLHRGIIIVDQADCAWRQLYVLRIVRSLFRWELLRRGAVFMHADGLAVGERIIAVLGTRRSGKTTLAIELLSSGLWGYTTEDDLCIVVHDNQTLALGWPGCIRVRRNTLATFPVINNNRERFSHPANAAHAAKSDPDARLNVFPEELQASMQFPILPQGRLATIVCLDRAAPSGPPARLSCKQLRQKLYSSWDVLPERKPGTAAPVYSAGALVSFGSVFNPFLADFFGFHNGEKQLRLLKTLSNSTPGYLFSHDGLTPIHRLEALIGYEASGP